MEKLIEFFGTTLGQIGSALAGITALIWTIIQQFKKADK